MDSLIGKTIDNYRIIEVIGRGGMGVVFKALDTSLEKIVALKMIDPFLARDENFVRRFKTEAKALAKLENQNIVAVYALRETESGFFMVMEYVESKPLSQYLQENGPFNITDTISITKQLLNAIGHAHKVGVIHRDIKPSNILICDNGKIKVTDFGLAKVVEQKGPSSTVTQARAGTLYYMSPEQVKG
ncbi:MAG: serine/threonine-protein kinase, partial [Ignavibacteria bacterium]|nr:serine/threonine-protein kinase [Ignavibacteria bacterium]